MYTARINATIPLHVEPHKSISWFLIFAIRTASVNLNKIWLRCVRSRWPVQLEQRHRQCHQLSINIDHNSTNISPLAPLNNVLVKIDRMLLDFCVWFVPVFFLETVYGRTITFFIVSHTHVTEFIVAALSVLLACV